MTILDKIIAFKKKEITKIKADVPLKKLVGSPLFQRTPVSLKKSLLEVNSSGIIAEFKRQSPSKGVINDKASIEEVTNGYLDANVAAQSILTDTSFFGGTMVDLMKARTINTTKPILRKDFIVDGFQIVEAKAIGADVILLIAACLKKEELKNYGKLAEDLGMEVLYEVHTQEDLDKIDLHNKIIGINNRNLNTLIDFRYKQHFKAISGGGGQGANRHGANGGDLMIDVPMGTQIFDENNTLDEYMAKAGLSVKNITASKT